MYTFPDESTATPYGFLNVAEVAAPPSPLKLPLVLLPANVLIRPVDIATLRIQLLPYSAMYTFPDESTAHPFGVFSVAEVAAPPSPL
jgi:hypothetical protein